MKIFDICGDENKENDMFLKVVQRMKAVEESNKRKRNKPNEELEVKEVNQEEIQLKEPSTKPEVRLNKKRMKSRDQSKEGAKPKKTDFKHPTQFLSLEPPAFQKVLKRTPYKRTQKNPLFY